MKNKKLRNHSRRNKSKLRKVRPLPRLIGRKIGVIAASHLTGHELPPLQLPIRANFQLKLLVLRPPLHS